MVRSDKRCDGCWTCRLRRKKCDETRPECANCTGLQITCHYGRLKPEWLDGAEKQEAMAAKIKSQIKQQAGNRRERHHASAVAMSFAATALEREDSEFVNLIPRHELSSNEPRFHTDEVWPNAAIALIDDSQDLIGVDPSKHKVPDTLPGFDFAYKAQLGSRPGSEILSSWGEDEMNHLMRYLDHVFPFLFPFYRTSLLDPGRGWIFQHIAQSKVSFHSVIGISAYFFSVALSEKYSGREHEMCKTVVWSKLIQQADMCFDMLQQDIQELNDRGDEASLLDKVRVMESIVQFLIFETAVVDILSKIAQRPLYALKKDHYVWDNRQECFRFFAGILLFIDTIASTSLRRPPQLLEYHPQFLTDKDDGEYIKGEAPIRLSRLVGCHNWAIRVVAEISALDVWKKENMRVGSFFATELAERARYIDQILEEGMSQLDNVYATDTVTSTRIWAYAAKIYLAVVVSGWQPMLPKIRSCVAHALRLLQTVVGSSHLRVLAWPLCVAGCMAERAQEETFRNLFAELDKTALIGILGEALRVMESVWQNRGNMSSEMWDVEACLNILGTPVLLA
ncbi:transcriptional regulator family: Fungal Specific TF [Trichoderma harzianum]|nr:transcriptional regulator family: Fungal Specific TF [Trichoderma harzianum]